MEDLGHLVAPLEPNATNHILMLPLTICLAGRKRHKPIQIYHFAGEPPRPCKRRPRAEFEAGCVGEVAKVLSHKLKRSGLEVLVQWEPIPHAWANTWEVAQESFDSKIKKYFDFSGITDPRVGALLPLDPPNDPEPANTKKELLRRLLGMATREVKSFFLRLRMALISISVTSTRTEGPNEGYDFDARGKQRTLRQKRANLKRSMVVKECHCGPLQWSSFVNHAHEALFKERATDCFSFTTANDMNKYIGSYTYPSHQALS